MGHKVSKKIYLQKMVAMQEYVITMGGAFKLKIRIEDETAAVIAAVDGWGDPIPADTISIDRLEDVE